MILCNLGQLLKERRLTVATVSSALGISRTTISSLCKNTNSAVYFDTIDAICMYLGIDVSDFFSCIPFTIEVMCVVNSSIKNVYQLELNIYPPNRPIDQSKNTHRVFLRLDMDIESYMSNPKRWLDIEISLFENDATLVSFSDPILSKSDDAVLTSEYFPIELQNKLIKDTFQNLPDVFYKYLEKQVLALIEQRYTNNIYVSNRQKIKSAHIMWNLGI